jgi:glycosidase
MNLFEIGHSLARQYGPEQWTLYKGRHLMNFLDNHDVERIASKLSDRNHIYPAYGLLFGMPGVPSIYYGSEWGIEGRKSDGDAALRPALEKPEHNDLTDFIAALAAARKGSPALHYGSYRNVLLTNRQIIFERAVDGERVLVAINAESVPFTAHFDAGAGQGVDLITGQPHDFGGGSELPPYSVAYWKV